MADSCLVHVFFFLSAGESCNDLTNEYKMVGMFYSGKSFQNMIIYMTSCDLSCFMMHASP